jgi:predicted ATPase/class 3 adenylate cyclase
MPDLPSGTVTFLFTDIEGSTRRWQQDPVVMAQAVARHLTLLREAVAQHGGVLFKVVGDATQSAFPAAPAALATALAAQQAFHGEPWPEPISGLSVRMALLTGEAQPDAQGDYLAPGLNRLARVLDAGHGGQILLTQAVQQLVRSALPAEAMLRDVGEHRLRDLLEPEQIFQLLHPELPAEFPPLRTLDAQPHNLPVQLTPLIGRDDAVARICSLFGRSGARLVTLTGPGGTGKTRLALAAAAELLDHFPDGAWMVDLAPLSDPTLVLPTIAATLNVRETGAQSARDTLGAFLSSKRLLLVLDNYEHLLVAAPVVTELLQAGPEVAVLVTSREPLRLRGEQDVAVAPLALPAEHATPTLETLAQVASVALFVQRAQAAQGDFVLTEENAWDVAEICRRLDGLPLAIELAAARIKLLAPHALLARLEHRLPLLTGGARDAPSRQRTLRDAIAWSYDLLPKEEQTLFRHLGVFVGGATLEAAEAVANPDGDRNVFGGLAALVDKSLLRSREGTSGEPRFTMLETVREYALERLAASGEEEGARQRLASHILALAERANRELRGPQHGPWLDRLAMEYGNVRAALAWLLERGQAATGLQLTQALRDFVILRGYPSEAGLWQGRLLAAGADLPPNVRANAYFTAGEWSALTGDYQAASRLLEEGLQIARRIGDRQLIAGGLYRFAGTARALGALDRAEAMAEESLALSRDVGDAHWAAAALALRGQQAQQRGDFIRARELLEEALALQRERPGVWGVPWTVMMLGELAADEGNTARAAELFGESLCLHAEYGDHHGISYALLDLGELAADGTRPEVAARLLGAAEALREAGGRELEPADRVKHDRYVARATADLGAEAFATAWAAGRALPLEQAITEARAVATELAE